MTMRSRTLMLAGTLGLLSLAACAPMQTYDRDGYDRYGQRAYDQRDDRYDRDYRDASTERYGGAYPDDRDYGRDARYDQPCDYCGTVQRISRIGGGSGNNTGAIIVGAVVGGALGNTVGKGDGRRAATVVGAVAGGAVANNMTRDNARYDVYRIDVHMSNGEMYSFEQNSADGLEEGSPVEVIDGRVYPAR